jgi:hypothetical protein
MGEVGEALPRLRILSGEREVRACGVSHKYAFTHAPYHFFYSYSPMLRSLREPVELMSDQYVARAVMT